MVVPVFVGMSMSGAGEHAHHMPAAGAGAGVAFLATGLHAVGYLAVTAFVAVLVFEKFGVGILRRAWFNFDLIWSAALLATGMLTLMQ
jgi:L-asparagine transporter-like permease